MNLQLVVCTLQHQEGSHVQKFWIILAELKVLMALDWRYGWPDGAKLAMELDDGRLRGLMAPSQRWNGVWDHQTTPN